MMSFNWRLNIRCEIRNGRAYLEDKFKTKPGCRGECCNCDSFLGVDIAEVGKKSLGACCIRR